jgi:hypothetical protein
MVDLSSRPTPHGFWMAMGYVRLPQFVVRYDETANTLRTVETVPGAILDRNRKEVSETDWQWIATEVPFP